MVRRKSIMRVNTSSAVSRTRTLWPLVRAITVSGVTSMCSMRSELRIIGAWLRRVTWIMVGSWKHIGHSGEKISITGVLEGSMAPSDKQFRSTNMKASRGGTTMEEECLEVLHTVEEALAE